MPLKGATCSAIQGVLGKHSQGHFNVKVGTNLLVWAKPKPLRVQDFPNVHSLMKTFFLKEGAPNVPPAGRLILFVNSWQKVTAGLVTLSYRYHPKFFSTSNIKEGGGEKND